MVYTIHPQYSNRQEEILALPSRFENEGEILYNVRNCIKKMVVGDDLWNIKSFKVPHFINRWVYRYCRKSKAERSYINAIKMIKMGINTPQPIACMIERNVCGISRSYYISEQIDYDYTLGDIYNKRPDDYRELLQACVAFIVSFHRKGVYFLDLSVGNILMKRVEEGAPIFYLVDVNRTKFYNRPLSCSEGVKAFCRLDTTPEEKEWILREYALQGGFDVETVMRYYKIHSDEDACRRRLKRFHYK